MKKETKLKLGILLLITILYFSITGNSWNLRDIFKEQEEDSDA